MERIFAVFVGVLLVFSSSEGRLAKRDAQLQSGSKQNTAWLNFDDKLNEITKAVEAEEETWSNDLEINEAIVQMYKNSLMTDCVFVVGTGQETETISAHSTVLAAASPVFRYALKSSNHFKIPEWKPEEFKKLLNFIYSGDLWFEDFEEACVLLKMASVFKLPCAKEAAQIYIEKHMSPNHLWDAIQCTKEAGDADLIERAKRITATNATIAMKGYKFKRLSQKELLDFISRENLNSPEILIVESLFNWGITQMMEKHSRTGSLQEIREQLGPAIMKKIRFLSMTANEFAQVHQDFGLLNQTEAIAVFLYLNNPEGVKIPDTLSTNSSPRILRTLRPSHYYGDRSMIEEIHIDEVEPLKLQCNLKRKGDEKLTFETELTMITNVRTLSRINLQGIQVPRSIEGRSSPVREHFDIVFTNRGEEIIKYITYNQVPANETVRRVYSNETKTYEKVVDNLLIDVPFKHFVDIPITVKYDRDGNRVNMPFYKIYIIFRGNLTYPKFVDSGEKRLDYYTYKDLVFKRNSDVWVLSDESFVYSLISV